MTAPNSPKGYVNAIFKCTTDISKIYLKILLRLAGSCGTDISRHHRNTTVGEVQRQLGTARLVHL